MKNKNALAIVLALPIIMLGFVFTFFSQKNSTALDTNFLQKAYADDPSIWPNPSQGCEGAGGCCGSG